MSGKKTIKVPKVRKLAKKEPFKFAWTESSLLGQVTMSDGGSFDLRDADNAKIAQALVKRGLIAMEPHEGRGLKGWWRLRVMPVRKEERE